jgi:hypothetical protein
VSRLERNRGAGQPRVLTREWEARCRTVYLCVLSCPGRLIFGNAEFIDPRAIPDPDREFVRLVPHHLADVEMQARLNEVLGCAQEPRTQGSARLAASLRAMDDNQRFECQRHVVGQETEWLGIIDLDAPRGVEVHLTTGVGNRLRWEEGSEPVILPFLVGKDPKMSNGAQCGPPIGVQS